MAEDTSTAASIVSIESTLASEARRLLKEGTLADVLGSLGAVAVISLAEFAHAHHGPLLTWSAGMALLLLGQLLFPHLLARARDALFLKSYAVLGVALGLGWASCALLVRPDDFAFEAFVVLALCVVSTAGSVFNAHHLPVLYGFQIASLGCLSVAYALRGGTINWGIATGFAILMATLIGYGRAFHRGFVRTIELGFENARLVAALTAKAHALEQANIVKTRFLASASHDLRQPVTTIGLLVGLVAEGVTDDRQKAMLARVGDSVGALENLLRGLLDLSRLDSDTITPDCQHVTLETLYAAIDVHARPVADAKGLRLRFRGDALGVRSDSVLLQQMLMNLVDNALRHTARGGVLVSAQRRGRDRVLLRVWDSGCGIAAADQQTVFEEFVQLDNTERDRRKGLGLGLAIVKRSAALLDHPLRLNSRLGQGSCFSIELPFEPTPARATPKTTVVVPVAEPRSLAGTSLWLLEDDPSVRAALAARLIAWGAQVEAFGRLAELVQHLEAGFASGHAAPHALLTDNRLPDGNGLQAIDRLRARHGAIPAVVLTGDTGPRELAEFRTRGVPVLHKPFHHGELRAILAAWVPDPAGELSAPLGA